MISVHQWSGRPGFNPMSCHTKNSKKMVLDASLLNTKHYKLRIKGKWRNLGKAPPLDVVAIETRAFGSPLTAVRQLSNVTRYQSLQS